jgi:hypothetical protein
MLCTNQIILDADMTMIRIQALEWAQGRIQYIILPAI